MKHRILTLPSRPLTGRLAQPWKCRRCYAQSAGADVEQNGISFYNLQSTPGNTNTRRVKQTLPSPVPSQFLVHVDPKDLLRKEQEQRAHLYKWAMPGHSTQNGNVKEIKGVVVSSGKMDRTVKVRVAGQRYEPRIKKYFASHKNYLVSDPNNSLMTGDVVILHRLSKTSNVRHVVASIVSPFGKPIADRPPIPTPLDRLNKYKEWKLAKLDRRLRRRADSGDNAAKIQLAKREKELEREAAQLAKKEKKLEREAAWLARKEETEAELATQNQSKTEIESESGKIPPEVAAQKNVQKAAKLNKDAEENIIKSKEIAEQRIIQSEKFAEARAAS